MNHRLTEDDLEKIFIASRFKKRNPVAVFFAFIIIFVLFFCLISYLLNFEAFNQKISWWYKDEFGQQPHQLIDAVIHYQASDNTQSNSSSLPNISNNSIFIEAINVNAPITFNVSNIEGDVSSNLKNGTIQLAGSATPGELGNVFITGHSSNYPWVKSNYNSVFALLGNLAIGDLVQIKYSDVNYVYRIKRIFVVDPTDTSVLKSDNSSAILTLMTCTPVGTNLHRLIVQADQIIPSISGDTKSTNTSAGSLPSGVR